MTFDKKKFLVWHIIYTILENIQEDGTKYLNKTIRHNAKKVHLAPLQFRCPINFWASLMCKNWQGRRQKSGHLNYNSPSFFSHITKKRCGRSSERAENHLHWCLYRLGRTFSYSNFFQRFVQLKITLLSKTIRKHMV